MLATHDAQLETGKNKWWLTGILEYVQLEIGKNKWWLTGILEYVQLEIGKKKWWLTGILQYCTAFVLYIVQTWLRCQGQYMVTFVSSQYSLLKHVFWSGWILNLNVM